MHQRGQLQDPKHQARINGGREAPIGQKPVNVRPQRGGDEGERGWKRQERQQAAAGSRWSTRIEQAWDRFKSGRENRSGARDGDQRGAVQIDATQPSVKLGTPPQTSTIPQDLSGWDRMSMAHEIAARYEEAQRGQGRFIGRSGGPGIFGRSLGPA